MSDESMRLRESRRVILATLHELRWERMKFRIRLLRSRWSYEIFENRGTISARTDESYLLVMPSYPGNGRPPFRLTPGYLFRIKKLPGRDPEDEYKTTLYIEITLTVDAEGKPRLRSGDRTYSVDRAGWREMVDDIQDCFKVW
jgi:hypothetical protein